MGYITGNSLKLGGQGQSDELLLNNAPSGVQFLGLRLNVTVPTTVTGTPTLATDDLVQFMKRAISNFVLEEGPKGARRQAYNAADGNDLRLVHRWWERNDLQTNFLSGPLAAGAFNMFASVFVPFVEPDFFERRKRLPGTTQVRQMKLRMTEGANIINAAVERAAGNIVVEVEYVTRKGPDTIAPILSMQRETSPRRDLTGPDGLAVLAFIPGTAAAASPLTAFTVSIGGQKVTDLQSVQSITRAYADSMLDQGGTGITDEATVIHFAEPGDDLDRATHGRLTFEEAKQDLSPIDMRIVYYPALEPLAADRWAKQAADDARAPVLLSQPAVSGEADPGAAATQPVRIYPASDARFTLEPGLFASPGSDKVQVSVPPHIVKQAATVAGVAGAAGVKAKQDASRRAVKVASLKVPGVATTSGERSGPLASQVDTAFAGVA